MSDAPMAFGKPRQILDHAPIENRSLFSVKKRVPNPRVPEPGRMLLRQKFECKSFLILMPAISQIYCSGAKSLTKIGAFLSSLRGINSRTSGLAADDGIFRILSLELLGLQYERVCEALDLTVMCR
jgi:hypothetical protein